MTQEQRDLMNDIASIVGRYQYFGDMIGEEQDKVSSYFEVDKEAILKIEIGYRIS